MKPGWWVAGVVAAIAMGGTLWYLRRLQADVAGVLDVVDEESTPKFMGALPSDVTEDEFDSLNFLF